MYFSGEFAALFFVAFYGARSGGKALQALCRLAREVASETALRACERVGRPRSAGCQPGSLTL